MNRKIVFLLVTAVCGKAQPACPPINFFNAKTIDLSVTTSSHLVLLRQDDGSYTAFELANASPYRVLRTISHFEKQLSNCVLSRTSATVTVPVTNPANTVAQAAAAARLKSGNYLFASLNGGNSIDVAVFDPHLQLISEQQLGTLPFGQPPREGTGKYLSLLLTDVNGDGKLDLVTQYEFVMMGEAHGGGGVSVLLGDGVGGFQPAGGFSLTGTVNGSMAVGDLNGDGKPDIVVGAPSFQNTAGALLIALGKGDGTFVPALLPTPKVDGPGAIAIADLNGDGKNDLVYLTSPVIQDIYMTNEVVVMLGNGDGTFVAQTILPVQVASPGTVVDDRDSTPGALAVGDVNGDGIPDIVTNGITILLGDGKGGFPNRRDFLNTARESVILTDFDGDGTVDVVIGIGSSLALSRVPTSPGFYEDTLAVFFGDGTGGLAAAPVAPLPTPNPLAFTTFGDMDVVSLAAADFNKDGIADLAAVRNYQSLSVFSGSTSGNLTPVFTYDFSLVAKDASPVSVVAADFNQDGILDLAVSVARSSSPGSIMVFLGIGDGTFLPPISTSAPQYLPALVAGDFNKDGRQDLAAIDDSTNTEQVAIFLGHGDGTFSTPQDYPAGMFPASLAIGDFNRDGSEDIAIANDTKISLLLGKGDGTFVPGVDISFPEGTNPGPLAVADLNGDGKLDLVSGATILLGHGDGTFAPPVTYPNGSPTVTYPDGSLSAFGVGSVAVGDIDGDGIPDVFLDTESVLIGNGDGSFHLETTSLPSMFSPVIAADFNGDGKLDIAGGFSMFGLGFASLNEVPFRRAVAVFLNLSHPAPQLEVVSAADFEYGPMAPHSIASAFGRHLASGTASAILPVLPTTLGGSSVSVQDQTGAVSQAEIYYASPEQVNFVLPASIEAGSAIVTITTSDGQSTSTEIQIAPTAPKLFVVNSNGVPAGYVVRVASNNVQTIEPIFAEHGGQVQEVPIDVSTGDVYLTLFGTGFDVPPNTIMEVGGGITSVNVTAQYAGMQGQFPGVDQINILLPPSLAGSGLTTVSPFLGVFGPNRVFVTIK